MSLSCSPERSTIFVFYRLAIALPGVSLLMLLGLLTPAVLAQTVLAQTVSPRATDAQPTNQQLLEQARQRLLEQEQQLTAPSTAQPPPPAVSSSDQQFDRYRLGPGDSLFISVQRFPDLNVQGTLDLESNITLPIAGTLNLKGLTLTEAQARIQTALNRYVIDPIVAVTLVAQRPVQVTVSGEVVRPGLYPLAGPQISVALVAAGGTTRLADLRSVRIRRTREDGSILERNVDLFTPLDNSVPLPDVRLEDGDAVIVPTLTVQASQNYDRSLIARSTLAQPQITIRVVSYASGTANRASQAVVSSITLPSGSNFITALTAISPNPDTANLSSVALIHFDPTQGRAVTRSFDARRTIRGDPSQNPPLEDNDVIIVGRNLVGSVTAFLSTVTQPFRDVFGFFSFFDAIFNGFSGR
jgi:polysaccharide biosynthesis/export protein